MPVPNGADIRANVQFHESQLIDIKGEHVYRSGRLSTKWYELDVGTAMHQVLVRQAALVWTALRETTSPARVSERRGRVISVGRIGDHARSLVIDSEIPLATSGFHRYRLTDVRTRATAR